MYPHRIDHTPPAGEFAVRHLSTLKGGETVTPIRGLVRCCVGMALLAVSAACTEKIEQKEALEPAAPVVTAFANPAGPASSSPGWTVAPSGRLYLSWQERLPDSSLVLKYATRNNTDTTWSAVNVVNTGKNMLASATDVPAVHEQSNGSLVAIWRGSHGEAGYDVVIAHSTDSGKTWSAPRSPHDDVTPTEHGFVSWLQWGDSASIVWLDGRKNADKDKTKHVTQLAIASLTPDGAVNQTSIIEPMLCDCCHTSSTLIPGGIAIAYRDREPGEIRDIGVLRHTGEGWNPPVRVHADNWNISGCPVNGPAISARGSDVAVAWFTAARDTARVRLAFSSNAAASFEAPLEINDGFPDGKVGVVLTDSDHAIVSWIERQGTTAVLRVRSVNRNGTRSLATDVAKLGEGKRAGGAPKLIQRGDDVFLSWTDPTTGRVITATVTAP